MSSNWREARKRSSIPIDELISSLSDLFEPFLFRVKSEIGIEYQYAIRGTDFTMKVRVFDDDNAHKISLCSWNGGWSHLQKWRSYDLDISTLEWSYSISSILKREEVIDDIINFVLENDPSLQTLRTSYERDKKLNKLCGKI